MIRAEVTGPALTNSLKASDLLTMVKHALEVDILTDPVKLLGGDVNSDSKIDAKDLLNLQKVLLELEEDFPGGTPSWKVLVNEIPLVANVGNTVPVNFTMVKIGDVSF